MTNTNKNDFDRRMRSLDPNYKFYETQSSLGVWKMLIVCLILVAVAGLIFVGLGVVNAYLLTLLWPVPLLFAAGYYGAAISSIVGVFLFKNRTRKIIAICIFIVWLASFVLQQML